ncbi:Fibronectin type III domain protein [uncultured archaeon]|nr:Fibronectin type III domain protein [uncultured archaeon]
MRDVNSSYSSGWNVQYWWRVTAFDGHVNSSVIYSFTTKPSNSPPVFGTPSPINGSTGNSLSLTWGIPINDPDGNSFNWVIQCSNGQSANANGASSGTKSLSLSGLANLTTYKVWVNATDPTGSGLWTRRWYTFTTKPGNSPPVFGAPSPVNGSTGNWWSPPPYGPWIPWNIPINDPEGNRFSWTIQCSNGQTASGTALFNGTEYLKISGLSYSTTYKVWVNVTDTKPAGSGLYTRNWYTFTTRKSGNNPPVLLRAPSPANGSTGNRLSLSWSIRINDLENNSFNWWIQCSNGQRNSSTTGALNGTKSLALSGLAYSTTYKVWVNATDPAGSGLYIRKWFTFTTKANDPPIFGTPSLPNGSTGNSLSFKWSIPINDFDGNSFNWVIQCSNGQSANANGEPNGTKSLSLSGLASSTTYKVWVNATDPTPTGSGLWSRRWYTFTTQGSGGNNPPVFGTPSTGNGSSGSRLSLSWSIPITDPEGTLFSWTIQCNNGKTNSGTGISDGTKSLNLSGLAYSKTYMVWVNATDPTGSDVYTRKWYTFTTQAIVPISIPTQKWVITSEAGDVRDGPLVADINKDGRMEIIRSGANGIVVYDGITGNVVWKYLMTMWETHDPIESIDLNKDGYLDIICSRDTGTIALNGKNGSQLWYNPNAPLYNKHSVVGDIGTTSGTRFINNNLDGYPEVFVCTAGSENGSSLGKVTALTHDGQIFATTSCYFPCYGGLSLGDTNHDGVYELYMCERSIGYDGNVVGKGVVAYWASNLTERWCHPEMLCSSHCPTLVDTNHDGILEVVALSQTGGYGIAVFNSADGSVIHQAWRISGLQCHSQPTIYDIDGDGNLEIIVGGGSDSWSNCLIWDLYTWSVEAWLPFKCWEPPAIADLNGDGRVEILECTIRNISIFDDNYVFRGSMPLSNNKSEGYGFYGMSMIIAQDIDQDNKLELVLNRRNQLYTYDTNGAAPIPRALSQFSYYSQHRGRAPYYLPSVGYALY